MRFARFYEEATSVGHDQEHAVASRGHVSVSRSLAQVRAMRGWVCVDTMMVWPRTGVYIIQEICSGGRARGWVGVGVRVAYVCSCTTIASAVLGWRGEVHCADMHPNLGRKQKGGLGGGGAAEDELAMAGRACTPRSMRKKRFPLDLFGASHVLRRI